MKANTQLSECDFKGTFRDINMPELYVFFGLRIFYSNVYQFVGIPPLSLLTHMSLNAEENEIGLHQVTLFNFDFPNKSLSTLRTVIRIHLQASTVVVCLKS